MKRDNKEKQSQHVIKSCKPCRSLFKVPIVIVLLILACIPMQSSFAEGCVKWVFNQYCLGGVSTDTLAKLNQPTDKEEQENKTVYTFRDTDKTIKLVSLNGTNISITRQEKPGDWINFTAWKVKLVRLYGRGEDLSSFPAYATARSSRLNAINAGRGIAEFEWNQKDYIIKLIWDHPDYIQLQYLLVQDRSIESENSEGL